MRLRQVRELVDSQDEAGEPRGSVNYERGWEHSSRSTEDQGGMKGDSTASPVEPSDCGRPRVSDPGVEQILQGDLQVSPAGKSFAEMVGHFHNLFCKFRDRANVVHSKVQCSGEVFPLPENLTVLAVQVSHLSEQAVVVLQAMCCALNSYCGVPGAKDGPLSLACQSALQAMSHYAADWSVCPEKFEGLSWEQFLQVKSIDYKGDEVRLARYFCWENLEPALPQGIGSIPLTEVCDLGTLEFVKCFEECLLPEDARVYTKPLRVMVEDHAWERVCSGLLERGVCVLIPHSQVYKVNHRVLLNGLFGVSKDEFVGP